MKRLNSPIDDNVPYLIFVLYFAIIFLSYLCSCWEPSWAGFSTKQKAQAHAPQASARARAASLVVAEAALGGQKAAIAN